MIPNVWYMNRNSEIYGSDAHHFNPARYLDQNGQMVPAPPDTKEEGHVAFGFGRRSCLGRQVATDSMLIDIAVVLWSMNIECAIDGEGNPIPPDVVDCVEDGVALYVPPLFFPFWRHSLKHGVALDRRPIPFQCKVTPRFPDAVSLLETAKENWNLNFF